MEKQQEKLEDLFQADSTKVKKRRSLDELVFQEDDFTIDFQTHGMADEDRSGIVEHILNWGVTNYHLKDLSPGTVIDSDEIPTGKCITGAFGVTGGQSVTIIRHIRTRLHVIVRDRQKRSERGDCLVKLQRSWIREDVSNKALKVFFDEKNTRRRSKRVLLDSTKPNPDG